MQRLRAGTGWLLAAEQSVDEVRHRRGAWRELCRIHQLCTAIAGAALRQSIRAHWPGESECSRGAVDSHALVPAPITRRVGLEHERKLGPV
ncbi:MAG: hypothetical protein C4289_16120, partial [Chloroflexota bacterium]